MEDDYSYVRPEEVTNQNTDFGLSSYPFAFMNGILVDNVQPEDRKNRVEPHEKIWDYTE